MLKLLTSSLRLVLAAAIVLPAFSQTVKVGDPAPGLDGIQWLKGTPVARFEPGQVYVVEFWATWCVPCRKNIPHLTELAKKYAGKVTFIGVDVRETHGGPGTLKSVKKFVDGMGAQMDYTVGMDDPARNTIFNSWMDAAGIRGIPAAFVIGQSGRIVWMGFPHVGNNLEDAIVSALSGKVDLDANRQKQLAISQLDAPNREAMKATAVIRDLLAARKYPELASLAEKHASNPEQKDLAERERYLVKLFLDPEWAKADIASRLPGELKARPRLYLDLVSEYADLLPGYALKPAIEALEAVGGQYDQRLAEIHYKTGNRRLALHYLDRYIVWVKSAIKDNEYLSTLDLLRLKYEGKD